MGGAKIIGNMPGLHVCVGRPNSILEMALHGMPTEALELLLEGRSNDVDTYHQANLTAVHFFTPTSAHHSVLTLVGEADRLSVAQFSGAWAGAMGPLPTQEQINGWNRRATIGKMYRSEEGEVIVRMDVDLRNMTLQQVIPVWLNWDRCVEEARELVASVRSGLQKRSRR